MKKAVLFATIALVLGAWTFGCTTVVVKDNGPEGLLPAKVVEQVDAATVSLRCEGIGYDLPGAILQARKGCIDWYITNKLAPKASERKSYEAVQQDLFGKLDKYVGNPPPGARDGKGPGVKSRTRLGEEKIRVEIIVHVQKQMLEKDLVSMGVMQSTEDLMDSVGMPSLMAVPSKANKASKLRGIMESIVNNYLSEQEFEVLDAKGVQDLGKFTEALGEVAGAEENEAAQIAMAIGADVYFVYEAIKDKKGDTVNYTVRVKAYETTTGTLVGDANATAPARYDDVAGQEAKALMEPLNDCMGKVIPLVMKFWKRTAPKGQRFYLVFNGNAEGVDSAMGSVLKRACAKRKLVTSVAGKVIFRAQCKMDNLELADAIKEGISKKMDGAGFNFTAKTRTSLIVQFQ